MSWFEKSLHQSTFMLKDPKYMESLLVLTSCRKKNFKEEYVVFFMAQDYHFDIWMYILGDWISIP